MEKKKCIAVFSLLLVAGFLWQQLPVVHDEGAGSTGSTLALRQTAPDTTMAAYFRNGQWRADARTLVAALDYLLAPESRNTNQAQTHA